MTAFRDTRHAEPEPTEAAIRGAEGNERLIAWTGAALLLGFAAEGFTILDVNWFMTWHLLIGYALLVPVSLKIASTAYRFTRYYTHTPAYRRKGPPRLLLRILGPVILISTVTLLLSGIGMMLGDTYRHQFEMLHKASFLVWFGVTAIHVLAYVWRLPRLVLADVLLRDTQRSGALQRIALSVGAALVGLALSAALLPWINSWVARR